MCKRQRYTTNPTECSAAATERSASESDLESSVESHWAIAEQWPSKSVERSGSTRWVLSGILQVILSHFHLLSAQWLLPSTRWDYWCSGRGGGNGRKYVNGRGNCQIYTHFRRLTLPFSSEMNQLKMLLFKCVGKQSSSVIFTSNMVPMPHGHNQISASKR